MSLNSQYPNCYLTSACYLVCKDETGAYQIPGLPLASEECYRVRKELSRSAKQDGSDDKNSDGGGLGLLPFDLPKIAHIDWNALANKLADILGVNTDDIKLVAKILLIGAALLVVLVLAAAIKK